jgi:dienelactone hydrolase
MASDGRPDSGKLGVVGFCFGGIVTNRLAVRMGSDLDAAVPFYRGQPSADDAAEIKAPLLANYGELDTRITSGWSAFDAALTALTEVARVTCSWPKPMYDTTYMRFPVQPMGARTCSLPSYPS